MQRGLNRLRCMVTGRRGLPTRPSLLFEPMLKKCVRNFGCALSPARSMSARRLTTSECRFSSTYLSSALSVRSCSESSTNMSENAEWPFPRIIGSRRRLRCHPAATATLNLGRAGPVGHPNQAECPTMSQPWPWARFERPGPAPKLPASQNAPATLKTRLRA
jgi:hypothetical protein